MFDQKVMKPISPTSPPSLTEMLRSLRQSSGDSKLRRLASLSRPYHGPFRSISSTTPRRMSFSDELRDQVAGILKGGWSVRDGRDVPTLENIGLQDNDACEIDASVLYADMVGSSLIVDSFSARAAAAVYKAYLKCACAIIRRNDGAVTAFDGDRVMAVFHGDRKNTRAAICGLQLNFAVSKIVNPEWIRRNNVKAVLTPIKHVVGIDTGKLFVAKTGIRNANDLVWVGSAANVAAKLSDLRSKLDVVWITKSVLDALAPDAKQSRDGKLMWYRNLGSVERRSVYYSHWTWRP